MESITDTATGVTFNDKGELVIPAIEDVPAADIKYCFRGVDVVPGQRLVIGETVESHESTTRYLVQENSELRASNEILVGRLTALASELEAHRLGRFTGSKFALHPLSGQTPENPEGVEVPDKGANPKGAIVVMPDKRPWALRATYPVNPGECLPFGGRKKTGFFVQIICVSQRSTIPGNPDEIGYEVLLSGEMGGRTIEMRRYFVSREEFSRALRSRSGWRLKTEGLADELIIMGFDDPHLALKALEDNAMEDELIEKGWVPPKGHRKHARAIARVAEQIQSGGLPSGVVAPQLESGPRNGASRHDEDRVETQKLPVAARPPTPPPAAIAASQAAGKSNSNPPPKDPASASPSAADAELDLDDEEEVEEPEEGADGQAPAAVATA